MKLETLRVDITANADNVTSTVNRVSNLFRGLNDSVNSSVNRINTSTGSIGGSFMSAASMVKGAVAGVMVAQLGKFALSCLEVSSQLAEVQNVVDVTFGKLSGVIDDFATEAQEKFGMAELAAKQYAGTMGSILSSMGFNANDSAIMSMNLTNLAGDISSFYNIDNESAFEKLRSAMSGETEAIKSLGINMSVASLNAYALSQGLNTTYDSMSTSEQALLRYNYLMSATSNQQGDFARTSESWANQTRTLTQEWDRLKASIGAALENVFLPMLSLINDIMGGINKIAGGIKNLFGFGGSGIEVDSLLPDGNELETTAENTAVAFDNTAKSANNTASGIKKATTAAKALKNSLMGFDEINRMDGNSSSGGIGGLGNLASAIDSAKALSQNLNDAYGYTDKLSEEAEEVNSFFGSAKLSSEQIKSIVSQIVDEKKLEKMAQLSQEISTLEDMAKNLENAKAELDGYNWMIEAGFEIDEQGYKKAVDNYIDSCNAYAKQSGKVVVASAEILFGEGSKEAVEMQNFYNSIQEQLSELGVKIKNKVNEAWADGVMTLDEKKEIDNLTSQYNKIIKALADGEAKAKIKRLTVEFENGALDESSFKELVSKLEETLQTQLDSYDEAYLNYTAGLYAQYELGEISEAELNTKLKEATDQLQKDINAAKMENVSAKLNIIANMNLSGLEGLKKDAQEYVNSAKNVVELAFSDGIIDAEDLSKIQGSVNDIASIFKTASPELKAQAKTLVEAVEPNVSEWEKVANDYKARGESVPEEISAGLNSYYLAKALTGDVDAILKMVGNQCEISPEVATMLQKAYGSSSSVIDSLCNGIIDGGPGLNTNIKTVLQNASNTLAGNKTIENAAKNKGENTINQLGQGMSNETSKLTVANATGTLTNTMKNALNGISLSANGTNLFNTLNNGFNNETNKNTISTSGKKLANSAKTGASTVKLTDTGKSLLSTFATGLGNTNSLGRVSLRAKAIGTTAMSAIKTSLTISGTTSKEFSKYGKYTVDGYNKGINDNKDSTTKDGGVLSKWVSGIGSTFMKLMGIHSPSRLFKSFGGYTVEGYNIGLEDEMATTEDVLEDWASIMNGFCDDIDLGTLETPQVVTSVPVSSVEETNGYSTGSNSVVQDRAANIILKIGAQEFARISVDSINKLIRQEGEMVLDMSYL